MTETGIEMLKMFEGFRAEAYKDAVGKWTIGYGHLILPSEPHLMTASLSPDGAESLLIADVAIHQDEMLRIVPVALKEWEEDALTSFVFNLGTPAFKGSTLRRELINGTPARFIADQFIRWVFAGDEKLPGLVRRRNAEAVRFLGGSLTLVKAVYTAR